MPKGGARTRSGVPPDPQALSRSRKDDAPWTTLPAEGRTDDPPPWPLQGQSDREAELWAMLWRKPQAVMWERLDQAYEVGLYARRLVEVEKPESPVAAGTLARQMADALGVTIPGMHSHRWKIATDDVAAKRSTRRPKKSSARQFKTADDGAA